ALAEIYQSLGGAVTYGGKPHARIYASAMDRVSALLGDAVERRRVLAVGDSVATDIAGANANGFDAVFITGAGGVNDEINNGVDDRRVLEDQIMALLGEHDARAVAVMERLTW
ncbi:MAG: HAD hydrolase-like protein, partial [Pseudomonadota bacterium]